MAETFNGRLEQLAQRRLDEEIAREKDTIGNGGLKDFADYRYRAGILKGLNAAKELLAQAHTDCQKQ